MQTELALPQRLSVSRGYFTPATWPFWAFHIIIVAGIVGYGWSTKWFLIAVAIYFARMTFVTAAYHRYFSHRAFKTSRWFQFVLALAAQTSAQKGVLWWAAHHRFHHKHSDTSQDAHSAKQQGFWHSHIGWILGPNWDDTDYKRVADLTPYRELVILNHPAIRLLPAALLAALCGVLGGSEGLFWGFFVSTVMLWHGSFTINSLSHMYGTRRYDTPDNSRNNLFLALLTTGEGWHNNHHHYQSAARQGVRWWEIDTTYYFLCLLSGLGLIWDLRQYPPEMTGAVTTRSA